ncbi:alpha/beta hydrolase [Candidatus Babeliales bacterium]|nr:alpha/beta hydrolase [Candidatus Babeliales bacterium]
MIKRQIRTRTFTFFRIGLITITIVFVVSYISLRKILYIDKDIQLEGKNMLVLAKQIRKNLIEKLHAKHFTCTTKDKKKLNGLFIERKNAKATLLLCHGYQCCKEVNLGYINMFPNCNAITFDFRSHGENKHGITTIGCHEYKDVIAVAQWFKETHSEQKNKPFVIIGVSMGGAAALKAIKDEPMLCDALIIDSSYSSLKSIIHNTFVQKSGLPTFPFLPIMEKMWNYLGSCDINAMKPLDCVKTIKQPLMLIHSCVDSIVPVQESLLMYAQATNAGVKLWIGPECPHGWLHEKFPGIYKKKVESFLRKRIFA